jgi:protocatechuate 3,4-dioxygenase beta subunit
VTGAIFNGFSDASTNQKWESSFLKSTSMGDLELLCDRAPVQIGNRVWIDTNQNGIQDPGEPPVAGVYVGLYAASGTTGFGQQLGTAFTNANGEFYFSSNLNEGMYGDGDHIGGGLVPGSAYRIRMDWAGTYTGNGALAGYELTQATSTSAATSLDTSVDNNATVVNSFPQADVITVVNGENNHTYDFGFKLTPVTTTIAPSTTAPSTTTLAPTTTVAPNSSTTSTLPAQTQNIIKVSVGDYVWLDVDRDGVQDVNEKGISGVALSIRKADGSPVYNVDGKLVTTTRSNKNGRYSFDNLPPGQYRVTVIDPAGFAPTLPKSVSDAGVDSSRGSELSVVLAADGQRDPTLDFGFYKPASNESVEVGNYVWKDRNGNGLQGPGDTGIKGAVLSITDSDGVPVRDIFNRLVRPQTTKSDGKYLFKNLVPGKYIVKIRYPDNYFPTTRDKKDRGLNSSTIKATSVYLNGGESDLTLDFGVVYRSRGNVLPATQ